MIPHYIIFWGILFSTCGYALWRGRKYEQIAALICLAATILSVSMSSPLNQRYVGIETGDLLVDCFVLVAFVFVALRSDRFWPLWVAGLQMTMSISHLLKAIQPDLIPLAYAAAERFWSYPILGIIAAGAWRSHQRQKQTQSIQTAS
jgi:hypothetical protein